MMPLRENAVHWDTLVYIEMFIAGIAAGAYVTAAVLELLGRGKSPLARSAHLLAFPLMATAGILLIVDLGRPERFFHMIVQSKTSLPMLKTWSPISIGSWAVLLFSGFAFISFVDALIERGLFAIGGWRQTRTLHGSKLGLLWVLVGGAVGFFIGAYSGVLLSVTNFSGWGDSAWIGPLYLASAAVTGMAALLLIEAIRGRTGEPDVRVLAGATSALIVWQMLLLVVFIAAGGSAAVSTFLVGSPLVAIAAAVVLGGIVPLVLHFTRASARPPMTALVSVLVLASGLLVRYAVVMGPQLRG